MAAVAVRPLNGLTGALATAAGYYSASGGGDSFPATESGQYLIHVINGNAASALLTVDDPNSVTPDAATAWNPDAVLTTLTATSRIFNLKDASRFRDASGNVNLQWSVTATVTFMVYRVN